jgi:ribosome-binding protein aMBF1 (putative translation factor)
MADETNVVPLDGGGRRLSAGRVLPERRRRRMRSATLEIQKLTGQLKSAGWRLEDLAAELDCARRQLTDWRSGAAQADHWVVAALEELVRDRLHERAPVRRAA